MCYCEKHHDTTIWTSIAHSTPTQCICNCERELRRPCTSRAAIPRTLAAPSKLKQPWRREVQEKTNRAPMNRSNGPQLALQPTLPASADDLRSSLQAECASGAHQPNPPVLWSMSTIIFYNQQACF